MENLKELNQYGAVFLSIPMPTAPVTGGLSEAGGDVCQR